ncbi:hypothetical protein PoB_001341000 [Plakobranchus ocellatus]|uniref:Galectin n=1 Tax=Plakobranchus ocellatus TaxID=259542 RepID=A0AAV3YWQ5_9GAST|nr:hypothetical protein PoB_001341000 [Plakobranchus ocellatus]
MRSQLPSLVTSMFSSPRIDFISLWILKGDLLATMANPFEVITITFLNGDQFAKGRHTHQWGKVLRLPLPRTASVQGSFAMSVHGERSGSFLNLALGVQPTTGPNQGDTLCGTLALCQGYPGPIITVRCGASTGIDPSPVQRKLNSRLGSMGQHCHPISGEGSVQGGMLKSDSHYCRAVTNIRVAPHSK